MQNDICRVIYGSTVYKCKRLEKTQMTISRDLLNKLEYIHMMEKYVAIKNEKSFYIFIGNGIQGIISKN